MCVYLRTPGGVWVLQCVRVETDWLMQGQARCSGGNQEKVGAAVFVLFPLSLSLPLFQAVLWAGLVCL